MKQFKIIFLIVILLVIGLLATFYIERPKEQKLQQETSEDISLNDLEDGCPKKDCIPSIDNPIFETSEKANDWLKNDDLVFALNIDGIVRAYPQKILNWHEIVNDTLNGKPIAVTFCPLCESAISFERIVNGVETDFGVSGKLFNSNLVMYDRIKENYWQQETGKAIIGNASKRGEKLKPVPMSSVFWSDWLKANPDTEILSRDTGYSRNYDRYPYGAYEENGELFFGVKNTDNRLPLKEPGYGFDIEGSYKFYSTKTLLGKESFEDTIGNKLVIVKQEMDGTVVIEYNNQIFVPIRTFWFAFAAFYPDTEIYGNEK